MPTYEYACKACGHEFEREQRITDKPVKKCPSCGAMQAKRLISRTSFVLKGSGWYNDLYASPSGTKKDKEAAAGGAAEDGGGSEKAADKPAGKEAKAGKSGKAAKKGSGKAKAQAA